MAMDQSNNKKQNKDKKQVATDNLYQSTFLPIFDEAQKRIKYLVVFYFLLGLSLTLLRTKIKEIIIDVKKKIPTDLHDRASYVNGLIKASNILIERHYKRMVDNYKKVLNIYNNTLIDKTGRKLDINNPKELLESIKNAKKDQIDLWSSQKGAVQVQAYGKQVKDYINIISDMEITTVEKGKKPISLWQKAELDIRHDKQMKMIDDLKRDGHDLCWVSTHSNCSKRCEKWQGKLVSLTQPSRLSGFRIYKLDGNWVYSLTEIMDQVDKYGYKNNIINGFNCRHHLTPYTTGSVPPTEYDKEDIKKQRAIETKIRAMEREIRHLKTKLKCYNINIDIKEIKKLKALIKNKITIYKKFCERNGYAWYQYRIGEN